VLIYSHQQIAGEADFMMLASTLASIMMTLASHQYVAIVGATLIDGSKEDRLDSNVHDPVVLIADGNIAAIGDRRQIRLPARTKIVHAAGRFVIPGLIDGFGAVRTQGFADAYLYEGVTTVIVPMAPKGANVDGEFTVVAPENGLSVLTGAPISGYSASGDIPKSSPWVNHRLEDPRLDSAELATQVAAAADAGRRIIAAGIDVWPDQLDVIVSELIVAGWR
jgi:hypothetical protein